MTTTNPTYTRRMIRLAGACAGRKAGIESTIDKGKRIYWAAVFGIEGGPILQYQMGIGPAQAECFAAGVDWCLRILRVDPELEKIISPRIAEFWREEG